MDRVEEFNVDGATIKYDTELINVYRSVNDPFGNQLLSVEYEPNPKDMSKLKNKAVFASGQADGFATGI